MCFTIQQLKQKGIKLGPPIIFIDNFHYINSLGNVVLKTQEKINFIIYIKNLLLTFQIYLLKKVFFRYDCWVSFETFKEGLANKDKFYNILTNRAVSDKKYEHLLNIEEAFKMNDQKVFYDFYLKVDVLLLACVFETF